LCENDVYLIYAAFLNKNEIPAQFLILAKQNYPEIIYFVKQSLLLNEVFNLLNLNPDSGF